MTSPSRTKASGPPSMASGVTWMALATLPEVLEAYLVSGEYDYLIKVAVQGTSGYERFLREKLYKIAGIRHSRSMFALRCMKNQPSVLV